MLHDLFDYTRQKEGNLDHLHYMPRVFDNSTNPISLLCQSTDETELVHLGQSPALLNYCDEMMVAYLTMDQKTQALHFWSLFQGWALSSDRGDEPFVLGLCEKKPEASGCLSIEAGQQARFSCFIVVGALSLALLMKGLFFSKRGGGNRQSQARGCIQRMGGVYQTQPLTQRI